MGARDADIVSLFQYRFGVIALAGAALGTGVALAVLLLIGALFADVAGGLAANAGLPWWGWLLLAFVPVAVVALSVAAARLTVRQTLAEVL